MEENTDTTIDLTDRSDISMVKDRYKPLVKFKYKQGRKYTKAEFFAHCQRTFNEADPKIFATFIERQDREFQGRGIWVGETYRALVKQQERYWADDYLPRFRRYCGGGPLVDPEMMPMGPLWYVTAQEQQIVRDSYMQFPLCYTPTPEYLKREEKDAEDRKKFEEERKHLERNYESYKVIIAEKHDKWRRIREIREARTKREIQEESNPVEPLDMAEYERREKMPLEPVKVCHWDNDILALATDHEESSEEIEEVKEPSLLPGTKKYWDVWQEKVGEYRPVQRSESPDFEQRAIQVKKKGTALWTHNYREKLSIIDPAAYQRQKDRVYELQKGRRATKSEAKRKLKEQTKEAKAKERKQRNTDHMREKRASLKAQKTGNASTADQEDI
jgi:hypothetical protein